MIRADDSFCANPHCVLHVSFEDPNVNGQGDWATLPDGLAFARVKVDGHFYCHACAEDSDNPPSFNLLGAE